MAFTNISKANSPHILVSYSINLSLTTREESRSTVVCETVLFLDLQEHDEDLKEKY